MLASDGTDGTLKQQPVRGCNDLSCPLTIFRQYAQQYISPAWHTECGIKEDEGIGKYSQMMFQRCLTEHSRAEFKPLSVACEREKDASGGQKCQDWALFNYCAKDEGVRYVFCRKTCLCDARFAAALSSK